MLFAYVAGVAAVSKSILYFFYNSSSNNRKVGLHPLPATFGGLLLFCAKINEAPLRW